MQSSVLAVALHARSVAEPVAWLLHETPLARWFYCKGPFSCHGPIQSRKIAKTSVDIQYRNLHFELIQPRLRRFTHCVEGTLIKIIIFNQMDRSNV